MKASIGRESRLRPAAESNRTLSGISRARRSRPADPKSTSGMTGSGTTGASQGGPGRPLHRAGGDTPLEIEECGMQRRAQGAVSDVDATDALREIDVGVGIAFEQQRSICGHGYVPADQEAAPRRVVRL